MNLHMPDTIRRGEPSMIFFLLFHRLMNGGLAASTQMVQLYRTNHNVTVLSHSSCQSVEFSRLRNMPQILTRACNVRSFLAGRRRTGKVKFWPPWQELRERARIGGSCPAYVDLFKFI